MTATRYERNESGYSQGGETTTYTYGNGLVSQYTDENGAEYYHYSNIGSTMYLTKNGVKSHEFAYSTYGELTKGAYGEVHFLYNGQLGVMTDENGLYYMRARYYNPEIRRFINQDIVTGSIENSQSLNRYAYCQGNPVNYLDPFGLEPCEFFSGLGHGMLNLMGLIPGVGDAFDIINAIWYLSEGKVGRAIESGIASLPFIGNFFPNTRMFNYTKRVLNIVSYGGTGFLAGQGMVDGGQALWAEINSGHCSGWNIALGIANIGLNGAAFFFSGKGLVQNVKELNYLNMTYIAQNAKWSDIDGGPELTKLLEDIGESGSPSDSYLFYKYKESLVKEDVLNNSYKIIDGKDFGDQNLIKELTKDGSNINDWAKMESIYTYTNEYGSGKIHYYYNEVTGNVSYYDCKMKISVPRDLRGNLRFTTCDKGNFWILELDENMIPIGVR